MVDVDDEGNVMPRAVYSRDFTTNLNTSYTDDEGNTIPMRRPYREVQGNVTVDPKTSKPTEGSK